MRMGLWSNTRRLSGRVVELGHFADDLEALMRSLPILLRDIDQLSGLSLGWRFNDKETCGTHHRTAKIPIEIPIRPGYHLA